MASSKHDRNIPLPTGDGDTSQIGWRHCERPSCWCDPGPDEGRVAKPFARLGRESVVVINTGLAEIMMVVGHSLSRRAGPRCCRRCRPARVSRAGERNPR